MVSRLEWASLEANLGNTQVCYFCNHLQSLLIPLLSDHRSVALNSTEFHLFGNLPKNATWFSLLLYLHHLLPLVQWLWWNNLQFTRDRFRMSKISEHRSTQTEVPLSGPLGWGSGWSQAQRLLLPDSTQHQKAPWLPHRHSPCHLLPIFALLPGVPFLCALLSTMCGVGPHKFPTWASTLFLTVHYFPSQMPLPGVPDISVLRKPSSRQLTRMCWGCFGPCVNSNHCFPSEHCFVKSTLLHPAAHIRSENCPYSFPVILMFSQTLCPIIAYSFQTLSFCTCYSLHEIIAILLWASG